MLSLSRIFEHYPRRSARYSANTVKKIAPARALFGANNIFVNILNSQHLHDYFKQHWNWADPLLFRTITTLAWDCGERAIQYLRREHGVVDEARSNRAKAARKRMMSRDSKTPMRADRRDGLDVESKAGNVGHND